jgi:hypothetical protein
LDYVRKKASHYKKNPAIKRNRCISVVNFNITYTNIKRIKVTNSIEQKLDRVIELLEKDRRD